jgi:hypothetical protein
MSAVIEENITEVKDEWLYEHTEEDDDSKGMLAPYQISFFPADFTLAGYHDKKKNSQLVIPPFQRNYVWDVVKASRLIESFLLGLPVPGVFLYKEKKTNRLQVIDGQQRITSAIRFFESRFEEKIFRLKGVQPKWEGKTFDELDEADRFQLQDTVLRATVVQQLDPDDDSSVYHVFERLNTGGVNLNPMEVRKCVYFGEYFQLLESLNEYAGWRRILGKEKPDRRLRDAELLLRVLSFGYDGDSYEKPMKQFLNSHMRSARHLGNSELQERLTDAANRFASVVDVVVDALGDRPFHLRQRLNYALTDAVLGTIFKEGSPGVERIQAGYRQLLDDKDFIDAVSFNTSDEKQVTIRGVLAKAAFAVE